MLGPIIAGLLAGAFHLWGWRLGRRAGYRKGYADGAAAARIDVLRRKP